MQPSPVSTSRPPEQGNLLLKTFREAIRDGIREEMRQDDSVIVLGEDIAPGGVFGATAGLIDEFGEARIIDTPISELGFMGTAFGAAITGLRPIVEVMFGDFMHLVMDVLSNQMAKYWFVSNEQHSVPVTIRVAVGAGGRFGPLHSQTPMGTLLNLPGIKIVAPSNSIDAEWMTRAAIRDDNPVVVLEHKGLYGLKTESSNTDHRAIGTARHAREGRDCTLVAAMKAVHTCLEAAESLSNEGIECDVIDLRSLRPMDVRTVEESAKSSGHLLVVEEGVKQGGYAADLLANVSESGIRCRTQRLCLPDSPIPFAPSLEDAFLIDADDVVVAVSRLLGH